MNSRWKMETRRTVGFYNLRSASPLSQALEPSELSSQPLPGCVVSRPNTPGFAPLNPGPIPGQPCRAAYSARRRRARKLAQG
jgi:hypothetical protein